jgi:hypothetical protein
MMSAGQQALIATAGGAIATITLHNDTYTTIEEGFTAEAIFTLSPDGTATGLFGGSFQNYTYRDGDIAANYEVKATLTSGTFTTGTAGSWLNLATEREWTARQTTVGTKTTTATFEIRKVGTTTILATATITLTATVN